MEATEEDVRVCEGVCLSLTQRPPSEGLPDWSSAAPPPRPQTNQLKD